MCSLEGVMLKLKLQYFGHLMQRADSLEKTLILGGIGGRRKWGRQRMKRLDGITDSMDVSLSELRPGVGDGRGGLACCKELDRNGMDLTEAEKIKKVKVGLRKHCCSVTYLSNFL